MSAVDYQPKRRRRPPGCVIALLVVCALVGGMAAFLLTNSSSTSSATSGQSAMALPTTGSDGPAVQAANTFLTNWAAGSYAAAGAATDSPTTASAFLTREQNNLGLTKTAITPTKATPTGDNGVTVDFTVTLTMGTWGTFSYPSTLTATGGATPTVTWSRSVYHPALNAGTHLRLQTFLAPRAAVEDRTGRPITATNHPGLAPVLGRLQPAPDTLNGLPTAIGSLAGAGGIQKQFDSQLMGTPGIGVQVINDTGGTVASTLDTIRPAVPGQPVRTTLDPQVQTAADQAVGSSGKQTGFVVIQPSTGNILAIVDAPGTGFDNALLGGFAPGSTCKVISAAALLTQGAVTPSTAVPCPPTITVGGRSFHNDEGESNQAANFAGDFAASCNTAFISLAPKLSSSALTTEASQYFGIGQPWHIGVPNRDGSWPDPGSDPVLKAADIFGQGDITANPLVMASVAATVESGQFHQPVLIAGQQATATASPLPSTVDAELKQMMRLTAMSGTAAPALASVPGDVGAKTGSAEVDGAPTSNAWLTAYRGDLAMAGIVVQGGHGVDAVGPIIRSVLTSVSG